MVAVVVTVAAAVVRLLVGRRPAEPEPVASGPWPDLSGNGEATPPAPAAAAPSDTGDTGVGSEAVPRSIASSDGSCPPSHPVKGKLTSGIYHVPGGLSYERTRADHCYVDAEAAEADGLRRSKM